MLYLTVKDSMLCPYIWAQGKDVLSPLLFNVVLESLANIIKQKTQIKVTQIKHIKSDC